MVKLIVVLVLAYVLAVNANETQVTAVFDVPALAPAYKTILGDAPLATILADSPVIAAFANDKAAAEEVWESPVYEEVFNDAVALETLGKSSGLPTVLDTDPSVAIPVLEESAKVPATGDALVDLEALVKIIEAGLAPEFATPVPLAPAAAGARKLLRA